MAEDGAFFHYEEDMFGLADVFERVAGDGDDVSEFAGFERADFVGEAEEFGVDGGAGAEGIDGLHAEINHLVKFFGVAAVRVDARVSAETDFYALRERPLEGGMDGSGGGMGFCSDGGRNVDAAVKFFLKALNGHKRGDVIGALLLHQVESFVIEEAAMFDGIDAGANGALGGFGAVSVGGGFQAERMCFVDDGVEFFLGELRGVNSIGGRENTAGSAHLDHVGSVLVVEADGVASLFGTVDDAFAGTSFVAEDARAVAALMIAVSAGSAESVDSNQHAWARDIAAGDGVAQTNIEIIGGTDIADSGDAGHEGNAGVDAGIESLLGDWFLQGIQAVLFVIVGKHIGEMGVRVDEAGEERGVAEIDDFGAGRNCGGATDGDYFAGGNDHDAWRNESVGLTIVETSGFQDKSFVRCFLPLSKDRRPPSQVADQEK